MVGVHDTPVTIDGRNGSDTVNYQSVLGPISVSLAAGTVSGSASIGTDTLRSIEHVFGTNASDTYDASNFNSSSANAGSNGTFNVFVGGGGNDAITGNGNTQVQYFNAASGVLITLGANGSGSTSGTALLAMTPLSLASTMSSAPISTILTMRVRLPARAVLSISSKASVATTPSLATAALNCIMPVRPQEYQ